LKISRFEIFVSPFLSPHFDIPLFIWLAKKQLLKMKVQVEDKEKIFLM